MWMRLLLLQQCLFEIESSNPGQMNFGYLRMELIDSEDKLKEASWCNINIQLDSLDDE